MPDDGRHVLRRRREHGNRTYLVDLSGLTDTEREVVQRTALPKCRNKIGHRRKRCKGPCGRLRELTAFRPAHLTRDKLRDWCIDCEDDPPLEMTEGYCQRKQ